MAGSKGVQAKGGASKGRGVKIRGGGVQTRGGRGGGGGRSNAGRSNGGFQEPSTGGTLNISGPRVSQNRSTTDNRGKGIATASREKGNSTSSRDKGKAVDGGGSSSPMDGGESTPGRKGHSSSHDSNVSARVSPQSQGTPHSNASVSRTLPLQYPASSNRVQSSPVLRRANLTLNIQPRQQLQLQNQVQEEEEQEDAEEDDDDDVLADDIEPEEEDGDDQDAVPPEGNGEDVDYEQLLANVMADPARQSLPLLSEQPHPVRDTLWFDRDQGLLTREIGGIFRRKFDDPWYSWSVTPIDKQERYLRTFASKFNWEAGITQIVRSHFDAIATKRL